jgi:hypothetical protein
MESLKPNDVEALYAEPLDRFIDARNELVKRLKAANAKDAAAEAAKLRKPSAPAWAVNQLSRADAKAVKDLFDANEQLRKAQGGGKGSGGREAFRAAADARQRAVAALTETAATILQDAGHGDSRATLDRVAATLLATAADEDGAELVRRGVLVQELGAEAAMGGFGLLADATGGDGHEAPSGRAARDSASNKRAVAADKRVEAAERKAEELKTAAGAAAATAREAEDRAVDAERKAAAFRKDADKAAREARRAKERADEAIEALMRLQRR